MFSQNFSPEQVDAMVGYTGENEDYKNLGASRWKGETYPGSGLTDMNVFVGGAYVFPELLA